MLKREQFIGIQCCSVTILIIKQLFILAAQSISNDINELHIFINQGRFEEVLSSEGHCLSLDPRVTCA